MRIDTTGRECLYVTRDHDVEAGGAHPSKSAKGEAAGFGVVQRWASPRMFKIIRRIDKLLLLFVALTIAGSGIGCEWFPESTFELASESRLPKWITPPPGLTRADVS